MFEIPCVTRGGYLVMESPNENNSQPPKTDDENPNQRIEDVINFSQFPEVFFSSFEERQELSDLGEANSLSLSSEPLVVEPSFVDASVPFIEPSVSGMKKIKRRHSKAKEGSSISGCVQCAVLKLSCVRSSSHSKCQRCQSKGTACHYTKEGFRQYLKLLKKKNVILNYEIKNLEKDITSITSSSLRYDTTTQLSILPPPPLPPLSSYSLSPSIHSNISSIPPPPIHSDLSSIPPSLSEATLVSAADNSFFSPDVSNIHLGNLLKIPEEKEPISIRELTSLPFPLPTNPHALYMSVWISADGVTRPMLAECNPSFVQFFGYPADTLLTSSFNLEDYLVPINLQWGYLYTAFGPKLVQVVQSILDSRYIFVFTFHSSVS